MLDSRIASRPVLLQLVDHRANVVVVDGGVRLVGALSEVPAAFVVGAELEVVMIVGFEPVRLRVVVVEGCAARPGAIAVVSLAAWVLGAGRLQGREFVPRQAIRDDDDDDDVMQGRLQHVGVAELVQLVCGGRRDAIIEIRDERCVPSFCGRLVVKNGQVVAARTEDDVVGEAAFFALLTPPRGRFRVHFGDEPRCLDGRAPIENIHRDTTFLVLEHARLLDEAAGPTAAPLQPLRLSARVPAVRPAMSLPSTSATPAPPTPSDVGAEPAGRARCANATGEAPVTGRFARFFAEVARLPPGEQSALAEADPGAPLDDVPMFEALARTADDEGFDDEGFDVESNEDATLSGRLHALLNDEAPGREAILRADVDGVLPFSSLRVTPPGGWPQLERDTAIVQRLSVSD